MEGNDFYTFKEYMKKGDNSLTASMEDYLEMICRLSEKSGFTRIHDLSSALNVQPPSATKMVQRISELKLLKYEKYGVICLTEEGRKLGQWLLNRHKIIEEFLMLLGISVSEILEQTEKIEHTISEETVDCFKLFITFMNNNADIKAKYKEFLKCD